MMDITIKKIDPKIEAQKFLEYAGQKDLSKMDKKTSDELQMVITKIKQNMDMPDILMPLIQKGKMLCEKAEMPMENKPSMNGEDMSSDEGSNDMSESMPEEPKKDYSAMDAINEIKALLAKVKGED